MESSTSWGAVLQISRGLRDIFWTLRICDSAAGAFCAAYSRNSPAHCLFPIFSSDQKLLHFLT